MNRKPGSGAASSVMGTLAFVHPGNAVTEPSVGSALLTLSAYCRTNVIVTFTEAAPTRNVDGANGSYRESGARTVRLNGSGSIVTERSYVPGLRNSVIDVVPFTTSVAPLRLRNHRVGADRFPPTV